METRARRIARRGNLVTAPREGVGGSAVAAKSEKHKYVSIFVILLDLIFGGYKK